MTDLASLGGSVLTLGNLLSQLKLTGGQALLERLLFRRISVDRALREGIRVPEERVDAAVSSFLADRDLFEAPQVASWLAGLRLREEDLRTYAREELLVEALRDHLIPEERVRERFRASPHQFARVRLESLSFDSAGAAAETRLQLDEGEVAWPDVARRTGGPLEATLLRCDAPPEAAALLFTADPGRLVGPVETDEGHCLYRILSREDPSLDESLMESLRDEMFREEVLRPAAAEPLRFLL